MTTKVHTGVRGIRDSIQPGTVLGRMPNTGAGAAQQIPFSVLGLAATTGGGGGGGSTTAFADEEVPGGTINGVNAAFTLLHTPSSGSLKLFKNGVRMTAGGVDYTLSGSTITYVAGALPQTGDKHVCDYRF